VYHGLAPWCGLVAEGTTVIVQLHHGEHVCLLIALLAAEKNLFYCRQAWSLNRKVKKKKMVVAE